MCEDQGYGLHQGDDVKEWMRVIADSMMMVARKEQRIKKLEGERDSHLKIISASATANESLRHEISRLEVLIRVLEAENAELKELEGGDA